VEIHKNLRIFITLGLEILRFLRKVLEAVFIKVGVNYLLKKS